MTTTITAAQTRAIAKAGFAALMDHDAPAMICAHAPLVTWSAPDWASLAHYARAYMLCDCEEHS